MREDADPAKTACWPAAGELASYHAHYVHSYDTLWEAEGHGVKQSGIILLLNGPSSVRNGCVR
jgi:hypothetical protein